PGDHFAFIAFDCRAAVRALRRQRIGRMQRLAALVERAPLLDHAHDLGNHVAGAADDDRVADAHVQPRDLVGVVQRGATDYDASHLHWRHAYPWRHRTRAADVDLDRLDRGCFFLRRVL